MRMPLLLARSARRAPRLLPLLAALLVVPALRAMAQEPVRQRATAAPLSALPLDRIAAVVGTKLILVSDIEAAAVAQQIAVPPDSAERTRSSSRCWSS
jgi:hypothetical protein